MRGSGGTAVPAASDSDARRAIVWVAALFFVKTVVLALFVTPLWDVPDEVGHYALIADIADGRGLPLPGRSVIPPDVVADWATKKTLSPEEKLNWVAQHPPLFHLLAVPFLQAARLATHDPRWIYRAPRLLSALSGAAALLVFFALLLEASGDPFFSFAAAASVGFVPMFSHMASGTNHDVFLALLCGVAALYWVRLSRTGRFSDALQMAVALALAGAVKFSALVVAGALVLLSIPFLGARRGARALQTLVVGAVAFSLPALWTLRQWILLGNARVHPVSRRPFDPSSFLSYLRDNPVFDHTFKNFIGLIGWTGTGGGQVRWFQISGGSLAIFIGLALGSSTAAGIWLWGQPRSRSRIFGRSVAIAVFVFCFAWLFSGLASPAVVKRLLYSLVAAVPFLAFPFFSAPDREGSALARASHGVFLLFSCAYLVNSWEAYEIYGQMRATNGRYFFAVLPFLLLAFGFPLSRLLPPGRRRNGLLAALLVVLFVNETAFFLFRVVPFYRGAPA